MSNPQDIASELSARAQYTPFPTAKRIFVFIPVVFWSHHHDDMKSAWIRWGGDSEFITEPARAAECGIVVFPRNDMDRGLALQVRLFFDRHGSEANVFQYCAQEKSFRRIDLDYLTVHYLPR